MVIFSFEEQPQLGDLYSLTTPAATTAIVHYCSREDCNFSLFAQDIPGLVFTPLICYSSEDFVKDWLSMK